MTGDSQVSTYMPALSLSNVSSFFFKKKGRVCMYTSICVFMISALCWLKRGIMKYKGCIIPWIDFNCPGLGTDLYGSLL